MRTSWLVLGACFLLFGCATGSTGVGQPRRAELPEPAREERRPNQGEGTAAAAADRFALAYTNWSPRAVARSLASQRRLAAGRLERSIREQQHHAARVVARVRLTVRGRVLAVAIDRASRHAFVVVRQWTTGPGPGEPPDETIRVFRAGLRERDRRWFVTSWAVVE